MANKGADQAAAHADAAEHGLSSAVGDYLKAIWQLAGDGAAATGDIARALGVTAPSVTGMLARLRSQGLVQYQPYQGAELTEHGRREAMRLLRRHRLLETFMIGELGFGWDEVHDEAERLEHATPPSTRTATRSRAPTAACRRGRTPPCRRPRWATASWPTAC